MGEKPEGSFQSVKSVVSQPMVGTFPSSRALAYVPDISYRFVLCCKQKSRLWKNQLQIDHLQIENLDL